MYLVISLLILRAGYGIWLYQFLIIAYLFTFSEHFLQRPCVEQGGSHRIQNEIGVHDDLLTIVKKRKLRWYGHISRSSGMAKTILQEGTVEGARRRGRQKKRWEDNIKEWTGMRFGDSLRAAEDREGWKGIVATSSVVPRRPPRLRDWDEMRWSYSSGDALKLFSQCAEIQLTLCATFMTSLSYHVLWRQRCTSTRLKMSEPVTYNLWI